MAKKKILLLSDDLRMNSGIATVSRDMVLSTVDTFDWIQVGAAIQHPEAGKVYDLSGDVSKQTGIEDANVKVIPYNGYGDQNLIRNILENEKVDAILHFTDPRFWEWLYEMEHEVRQHIPLMYLNIWDDLPDPWYNREAYSSCDLLMAISKQTYGINTRILSKYENKIDSHRVTYVPHGISENEFFPISESHPQYSNYLEFKNSILKGQEYDFVIFWNNRNIRRKNPGDVILAYKTFYDSLTPEQQKRTLLIMHTAPVDENGTHLPNLIQDLAPYLNVAFSDKMVPRDIMNYFYNLADVTLNMTSNEGFGLATAESIMSGTPVIVNVTGGLQDQCGFSINENGTWRYLMENDYVEIGSLHNKKKWKNNDKLKHGEWVIPVWPSNRSLQGSVPTPYIFDDRVDFEEVAEALISFYKMSREDRKQLGSIGRNYMLLEETGLSRTQMGNRLKESISTCIEKFQPRKSFELFKV
jgi:glycosyltransferase involved in cell wall biosynthesis